MRARHSTPQEIGKRLAELGLAAHGVEVRAMRRGGAVVIRPEEAVDVTAVVALPGS